MPNKPKRKEIQLGKMALVDWIVKNDGMTRDRASHAVDIVFEGVLDLIITHTDLSTDGVAFNILNFGKFSTHVSKPRIARNPRTGESVEVAPTFRCGFRGSHMFKRRLRECEIGKREEVQSGGGEE